MQWYLLLGISTGMRTMTAMAVVCWFSWMGLLPQSGWSFWSANLICAIVFTIFAIGEYFGDTRPEAPNRTAIGPLLARFAFGALTGALTAHAIGEPIAGGIVFGLAGVCIGAFGCMRIRVWLANKCGRDLPIALTESLVALLLAVLAAWMLHHDMIVSTALNTFPRV